MPSTITCLLVAVALIALPLQAETAEENAPADTSTEAVQEEEAPVGTADTAEETEESERHTTFREKTTITVTEGVDGEDSVVVVRETRDSVYVVKSDDVSEAFRQSGKHVGKMRKKGFGIAGGPVPGFYAIDMDPVRELAQRVQPLQGKSFDFGTLDYKPFRLRGGMGYVGLGNGLRIGGGGSGGKTDIVSDLYSGDSTLVLQAHVGFGGFLIEKAFVRNKFNFILGGYLGGGDIEVSVNMVDMGSIEWIDFDAEGVETNKIEADFMLCELHGGFTYSVVSFFHIGLNVAVPFFLSPNGFASPGVPYSSEFFTANPGIQLRIMFGNPG